LFAGIGERGRYRPYFENYTVDASIFEMISVIEKPACWWNECAIISSR